MHKKSGILLIIAGAVLLAAALLLCGCGRKAQLDPADIQVMLPEPEARESRQILGDTALQEPMSVQLYCASDNSMALTTVTRKINFDRGENRVERILKELLSSAPVSGAVVADLVSLEIGSGVATVNLSLEAGVNRSDEDYLLLWNNGTWCYNDSRNDPAREFPELYSGTIGYICEYED